MKTSFTPEDQKEIAQAARNALAEPAPESPWEQLELFFAKQREMVTPRHTAETD
jgi:hypothetical protein